MIHALARLDYRITRQTGSHIRLTCLLPTPHALTIPNHAPIKVGTLNAILAEIAAHRHLDKAALIDQLFG